MGARRNQIPGVVSLGMSQLSKMSAIFDLWSLMFDGRGADAIIKLAADSVPSISQCRTEAAYRVQQGSLADGLDPSRPLNRGLDAVVVDNLGSDLEISLRDGSWRYVFMLRTSQVITGALVVCAPGAPPPDELALLMALGKQAAAAMACAMLAACFIRCVKRPRAVRIAEERSAVNA